MISLDVNTDELIAFTHKLESIRRRALPIAVFNTLKGSAFDMRTGELMDSYNSNFKVKAKGFYRTRARVEVKKTFDVNRMRAEVGMVNRGKRADTGMGLQERGGTLEKQEHTPLRQARVGKSKQRVVAKRNRLSEIDKNNIIDANTSKVGNRKQRFIRAALYAERIKGKNAYVYGPKKGNKQFLFRVDRVKRKKNAGLTIKVTPLYLYRKRRDQSVDKTKFNQTAALRQQKKMNDLFIKNVQFQINKIKNR